MKLFLIELHHQVYAKLKFQSYITAQIDKTINNMLKSKKTYDHVMPFQKGTNSSVPKCSLRGRLRSLIKNASKLFTLVYSGTLVSFYSSN